MKWKLVPYFFIFVFTTIIAVIRGFLVTQWSFSEHVIAFFAQFAVLSLIWIIIRTISIYLDKRLPFEENLLKRIVIQVIVAILFNLPIYGLLLMNADKLNLPFVSAQFLAILSILYFVFILFMNLGYNAFYFFLQWQKSIEEKAQLQVEAAELQMDKSKMQYHHLKNQVNPHFLFNTFTSLDGLIHSDPNLASEFIVHLSKVYRYVLQHKENEIVTLQTETAFIKHYVSLLQLRYEDVLEIDIRLSPEVMERGIVMVTLQMLIDNAIKHNALEKQAPLKISIWDEDDQLCIRNNKQLRKQLETSNRHGLRQLQELYSYLTPKKVQILDEADYFQINLPLL